ncbi:putative sulfate exporter family transporter [Gemmata sp. JC717]|nr:putative sulfate exporter family transporter [Gemmata algarum]MDY3556302.1 putative sulfate exporter family transporter [Gemmata algarum]
MPPSSDTFYGMKSWFRSEDVLSVLIGVAVIGLSLATLTGWNLLGWSVKVNEWVAPAQALAPSSRAFTALTGSGALAATFVFLLGVLSAGAAFLRASPGRFAVRFAVLFVLAFACWAAGHNAYIAANPNKLPPCVSWSLGLTGEAGYLLALIGGLLIGNLAPRTAAWFKDAARPELFIKAGIVIYGAVLGAKAADESGRATAILFRGLAAIVEAYLIYWAVVYLLARKVFGFSREWAAPLASGISICGVTAAITTGAAIRARPIVPVMVSSLVVVFAVIEMLVLPGLARVLLPDDPMVAAGWMGLAVKTDGAAFSSGEMTAGLYFPDPNDPARKWMALTTTTVKVFIDVFIGVWAVVLSVVWAWKIDKREENRGLPLREIWERFPKFVFGYALTFGGFFATGLIAPHVIPALKQGTDQADVFRRLFFVLTFFSIGLATNVRRLWAEGLGRLALVYVVSLFGFVIWVGLAISWLFFHGVPAGGK